MTKISNFMKRHAFLYACIALTALLMTSCVSSKKFNALEAEKNELANTLAEVQQKVNKLEMENNQMREEKDQLSSNLTEVKGELSETKSKVEMVEKDLQMKSVELDRYNEAMQEAFADINQAVTSSDKRIADIEGMLYLDLDDTVSFQTASATVSADDKAALEEVAEMLKANPKLHLVIEGHADARSINTSRYNDNWDLSVDRAVKVVRKLISMGVDPTQLTAAGKAEFQPAVQSDDPRDPNVMSKNRRTEFMIVPKVGKLYKVSQTKS